MKHIKVFEKFNDNTIDDILLEFIDNGDCKKIIASYPQIEGTLPISKETVQAWINAGTPKEGIVNMLSRKKKNVNITVFSQEKDWKEYVENTDSQGNLLLEFSEQQQEEDYFDEDIYDAIIDFRKNHPEKTIIVESPVPTDEEIKAKADNKFPSLKGPQLHGTRTHYKQKKAGWIEGYKQALKDLGHE
jgi:hypothetical protein